MRAAIRQAAHACKLPAASCQVPIPLIVPQLTAGSPGHAKHHSHVSQVHESLEQHGILKVRLGFPDPESQYLENLVLSLHRQHGHQLPISHSASRNWFWDVRPSETTFQTANHQARSETMDEFPWHTDCSYEDMPPRYFALHVIQHDRYGGGTLSAMNTQRLIESLSAATLKSLMRREYSITIPLEFIKDPARRQIVGSLITAATGQQQQQDGLPNMMMRFRRDLVTPLTERAAEALRELDAVLKIADSEALSTLYLTAEDCPAGSIIMMDNRRWLHSRNNINDPARHLRRIRWDALPFDAL